MDMRQVLVRGLQSFTNRAGLTMRHYDSKLTGWATAQNKIRERESRREVAATTKYRWKRVNDDSEIPSKHQQHSDRQR